MGALAEHVGRYLPPSKPKHAVARFVAQMNRVVNGLGCSSTQLMNPHGMAQKGHLSCAADIIKLSRRAMEWDVFRAIVKKKSFHEPRNWLPWRNTNQLLGTCDSLEIDGLKTGWVPGISSKSKRTVEGTNGLPIHGCLASTVVLNGERFFFVVLGSAGKVERFTDSKVLMR